MCAQDQDNPFSNYSYKACKAQAPQKCLQEHLLSISHFQGNRPGITRGVIGYHQIFWFIEGDLRGHTVPQESLLGACVNLALRKNSILVRTSDEVETTAVIKQLVSKCSDNRPGIPTGGAPAAPLTKRKRDSDAHLVFLRMLQCIPSISEGIARKIAEIFPTIPDLQRALSNMPTFPQIRLDQRHVLGKTRLTILRQHFCGDQEEEQPNKTERSDNCSYVKVKCYPTGPRDNGEFEWRCSICGKEF